MTPARRLEVRVADDAQAVAEEAVGEILAVLVRATAERPVGVVLSGGRTPLRAYEHLLGHAAGLSWDHVHLFWGDERCVPPDHPDSNYRHARSALLDAAPVPPANVHRIRGEDPPDAAAAAYETEVRAFFAARGDPTPSFDLILLGMGADGHTASLFPGGPELDVTDRFAVASRAPVEPHDRVTLTLPVLSAARHVVFLVTGAEKRDALDRVLAGDRSLPAARVDTDVLWLVDRAASGRG